MKIIKGKKILPDDDDCHCGKPVNRTANRRVVKKVIKKR